MGRKKVNNNTFGGAIRNKRLDMSLSCKDLAEKLGLTESYLSRIENNKEIPAYLLIELIERTLKIELEYRFGVSWKLSEIDKKKARKRKKMNLEKIAERIGKYARKKRLRMMLFSGIEFKDFKGMAKCNKIKVC